MRSARMNMQNSCEPTYTRARAVGNNIGNGFIDLLIVIETESQSSRLLFDDKNVVTVICIDYIIYLAISM